jgi:hypothetical protein
VGECASEVGPDFGAKEPIVQPQLLVLTLSALAVQRSLSW